MDSRSLLCLSDGLFFLRSEKKRPLGVTWIHLIAKKQVFQEVAAYDATVNRNKKIRSRQVIKISGVPRVLSFIRFDLSGEIDKMKVLKSATLQIYTLSTLTNSTRVTVRPVIGSFNASTVTWDTSPRELGPSDTASNGAINASSNTWISIDITNAVEWSIGKMANSSVTLRLSTKNSRTLSFASNNYSGGSYRPQLVLEVRES